MLWCVLVTPGPSLAQLPGYGESDLQPSYGQEAAAASAPMSGMDMLRMSVPGNPGQVSAESRATGSEVSCFQDYPIYAEVPDTSFSCDGPDRTEGGYYADVEAECQPFHVCSVDSNTGGLVKYSFLCPNGTIFNQESEEVIVICSSFIVSDFSKILFVSTGSTLTVRAPSPFTASMTTLGKCLRAPCHPPHPRQRPPTRTRLPLWPPLLLWDTPLLQSQATSLLSLHSLSTRPRGQGDRGQTSQPPDLAPILGSRVQEDQRKVPDLEHKTNLRGGVRVSRTQQGTQISGHLQQATPAAATKTGSMRSM